MAPDLPSSLLPADVWLSIVGIGEDGLAGLGERARQAIAAAEFVFGGARHLALAKATITGEAHTWPQPFDSDMKAVTALKGRKVCVLASGDPFFFGVGVTLARQIPADEFIAYPAPSAFSLAASRLGWALQNIETVSLHGRSPDLIRPLLHPGRKVLALTSDEHGPATIAKLLAQNGFGESRITVLEALGGEREKISRVKASGFDLAGLDPLNVVAVEVQAGPQAASYRWASVYG